MSRVWLITGANSGFGLALSQYSLSKGDKVIAAARDLSKLPPSLKGASPLQLDLTSPASEIHEAGAKALSIYGHIDVLVNNAAYCLTGPIEECSDVEIKSQFQTNVFGPLTLTQSLLPSFRARKSGHIVNISSVAGFDGRPGVGIYSSSKAALEHWTEALYHEVKPFGVRVVCVLPGYFLTNFLAAAKANTAKKTKGVYVDTPHGSDLMDSIAKSRLENKQVGDVEKAVARIWEVVDGSGIAGEVEGQWLRVPLGSDAGERMRSKIENLAENVDAYEKVWRSTDMEVERLPIV